MNVKKNLFQSLGLTILLVTFLFLSSIWVVKTAHAQTGFEFQTNEAARTQAEDGGVFMLALQNFFTWVVNAILSFVALLTSLGGIFLNGIVYITVVKVKDNYDNIKAIDTAWSLIRDIANMGFIFVLLYAAIEKILGIGGDVQKTIRNVIIIAILINFSLFFTKVVIDISNVLALTFYDAIAPGALNTAGLTQNGISNAFMKNLNLQSLYDLQGTGTLGPTIIMTTGVMGSIMLLIAAFVFFAVAIMFLIRYVVLILVLILSPIAFMANVLPQLEGYAEQWKEALIGQAFFAPIYFMLTWITLQILGGVTGATSNILGGSEPLSIISNLGRTSGGISSAGAFFATFINFAIVIVFLIVSLIVAKSWASKTPGGVDKLMKWGMSKAGGATFGLPGRLGRNTVGRIGQAVADSQWLKERAPDSRTARLALAAGRKTGASSFDFRATKIGETTVGTVGAGKAGGKGGYRQQREDVVKRRMAEVDRLEDTVTGADVEREMERRGYGRAENERLGRTAYEVEAMRREVQLNPIHGLVAGAQENTRRRRERFLHSLSQTSYFRNMNLYSGVGEDAEAARRLRAGQSAKSTKDKLLDALKEYETESAPTPAPTTPLTP